VFSPIAIVGIGCVLPDAETPSAFWDMCVQNRSVIRSATAETWQVSKLETVTSTVKNPLDGAYTYAGARVDRVQFEHRWRRLASENKLLEDRLVVDEHVRWSLCAANEALKPIHALHHTTYKTGVILGNLSFPTWEMNSLGGASWLRFHGQPVPESIPPVHSESRWMSSSPAQHIAQTWGMTAESYCIDAACASSLYAIALASEALHAGHADVMLAGAVNGADNLFLHVGFSALHALSQGGVAKPFDQGADGLIPAEGCAMVSIMRLADAEKAGLPIQAVIRGVGLSNDGRARNLLAPSSAGQIMAMRRAYAKARLTPDDVDLIECHATGTLVGDKTEIASIKEVFAPHGHRAKKLWASSHKGNCGHLITVAGMAGLIKSIGSIQQGMIAPTAQLHHKINEIEKESSWLEVPNQSVSWNTSESSSAPRRVGINAFGFGGNNAHLIIEEYKTAHTRNTLDRPHVSSSPQGIHEPSLSSASLAVVAMLKKTRDFDEPCVVHANGLKIPPADMMHCLPQQLLSFEACREIWAHLENQDVFASLQGSEKSVIMAMETDMDVTTPSVRWRWDTWLTNQDRSQREILTHEMHSATVLGCMPNIVANRVNMHEDFRGPSFSLSASDASLSAGLHAAKSCLTQHDVKVVLLGATDIVSDIRHQDAVAAQGLQAQSMQDGAWIFAITTKEWAQQHQVPIKALLTVTDSESLDSSVQRLISTPQGNVIHAYAQLYNRLEKLSSHEESQGISPCTLTSQTLWGHSASVILSPCADSPSSNITSRPLLYVFAAQDEKTLQEALVKKKIWEDLSEVPPVRLAFVARNTSHAHQLIQACLTYWREGANHPWPQEVFWSREPSFTEENAMWVFGSTMMLAPQFALDEALTWWSMYAETARKQCGEGAWETWLYRGEKPESCLQQINIQSCVAQLHASLWKTHIQSKVRNAMGLSLGESNALLATGIWSDPSAVLYDCGQTGLFTEKVAGAQTHVVFSDGRPSHGKFMSALVRGDMDSIRKALLNYPLLHCLIEHDGHEGIIGGPHDVLTTWLKTRRIPHVLLPYAPVAHCQAVSSTKDVYRALHHRNTKTHNVRIYSHGVSAEKGHRLELHADAIADAILHQFTHSVSFPSVIQQAYLDGVRWFIDMSPHGFVSRWLKRILQKKNDVHIVSMTGAHGRPEHWLQTLAMLFVNGAQLSSSAQEVLYSSTSVPLSWPASTAKKHDTPAMDSSVASEATADRLNMPLMPLGEHSLHMQSSIKQSLPLSVAPSSSPVTSSISSTKPNVKSDLRKIWPHEKIRRMAAPISLFTANITSQHGHMIEEKESAQTWRHRLLLSPKWHTQDILSVDGLLNPKMSYTVSQAPDSMLAYNDVWQQWYASIGQSHEYFLQQAIHNYQIWQNSHVYYMEQLSIPQNLQHFSMLNHSPIHAFSTQTSASLDATPRRDMIPQSSIPKMAVLWNRSDLENLASGDIADYFGPAFQIQKDFKRQVRMPQPPLLLCDRVMSTTAKAGILEPHQSMETQTDIAWNSWYLHDGRIPAGVLIESGQADLLLISYMGVDWENRGERVYRLLGCEVTYVAPLPLAGNTVHHHIVIDGFAQTNQTRIFFFHSDCTLFHNASPVMHVRQGQAGFFTDEELAHSNGVLWKPEDVSIHEVAAKYIHSISPLESHGKILKQQQWESTALQAFSQGHIADCFGETYSQAKPIAVLRALMTVRCFYSTRDPL
jgi:acyl transferase domain-containing protein